jgi:hypothetical protein
VKIQRKVEVEMKRRYSKALEKKRIDELVVGYQVQKMEVKAVVDLELFAVDGILITLY